MRRRIRTSKPDGDDVQPDREQRLAAPRPGEVDGQRRGRGAPARAAPPPGPSAPRPSPAGTRPGCPSMIFTERDVRGDPIDRRARAGRACVASSRTIGLRSRTTALPFCEIAFELPLGDVDELLRGHAVGGLPQLLDARALQHLVHPLLRELAQRVGGRTGERLRAAAAARWRPRSRRRRSRTPGRRRSARPAGGCRRRAAAASSCPPSGRRRASGGSPRSRRSTGTAAATPTASSPRTR